MIYNYSITITNRDGNSGQKLIHTQHDDLVIDHKLKIVPLRGNPGISHAVKEITNAFGIPLFNATISITHYKYGLIADHYKILELIAENDSDVFVVVEARHTNDDIIALLPDTDKLFCDDSRAFTDDKPAFACMNLNNYMKSFHVRSKHGFLMASRHIWFMHKGGKTTFKILQSSQVADCFDSFFLVLPNTELMRFFDLDVTYNSIVYMKAQLTADYVKKPYDIIRFQPDRKPVVYQYGKYARNTTEMMVVGDRFTYTRASDKSGRLSYVNSEEFVKTKDIHLMNKYAKLFIEAYGEKHVRHLSNGVFYSLNVENEFVEESKYNEVVAEIKKTYKIDNPTLEMIYTLKYLVDA